MSKYQQEWKDAPSQQRSCNINRFEGNSLPYQEGWKTRLLLIGLGVGNGF
jgi:hypothetical protein